LPLLSQLKSLNNTLMRHPTAANRLRSLCSRLLALPLGLGLLAVAACNGTAVVTLTSTPSSDTFLAYRVGLASIKLQTSDGKSSMKVLPAGTTVDLAKLLDLTEVLGVPTAAKGTFTSAVITLDYSAAQIIYDDGSVNGVALSPLAASGAAAGQISVTANLDPSTPFRVAVKRNALLALDFNLAASNLVNLSAKTVTITPMIAASAMPIDTKQVLIRGPLAGADSTNLLFTTGVMPFDGNVSGAGELASVTSDVTTYEVNGTQSTGSAGLSQIAGLGQGVLVVAYGTLSATDTVTAVAGSSTSSSVTFSVSQVLAGSSVQGSGSDRISGIVAARSGNTLAIEDGTMIANDGVNTFIPGTITVNIGSNTLVTVFGQGTADINTAQQISVGSSIDAFGTANSTISGDVVLDASAGRVRIDPTTASGLVTAQGNGGLTLNLGALGGRSLAVFDFSGTGANASQYSVATGALDLTNSIVAAPVVVSGLANSFGVASPNFTATTLLDSTTIPAELVIDWGAGTPAPFTSFDTTAIALDASNSSIGLRHQIQVGSQIVNVQGLSTDPLITPNTGSTAVYAIGHSVSSSVENFNTYAAFIVQLQTELNGVNLVTGMTAVGEYTTSTFAFSATSITIFLNN
jgi:hypothetical protein